MLSNQRAGYGMLGSLPAGRDLKFRQYGADMVLHGFRRKAEACRDLLVGLVFGNKAQNFGLPGSQTERIALRLSARSMRDAAHSLCTQIAPDDRGRWSRTELYQYFKRK